MAPTSRKAAGGPFDGPAWMGPTGRIGLWAYRQHRQSPGRQTKANEQAAWRAITRDELVAALQQTQPGTAEHRAAQRALRRFDLRDRWVELPPAVQGILAIGGGTMVLTVALTVVTLIPALLALALTLALVTGWAWPAYPLIAGHVAMWRRYRPVPLHPAAYLTDLWRRTATRHRRLTPAAIALEAAALALAAAESIIQPVAGGWSAITILLGLSAAICVTVLVVRHHRAHTTGHGHGTGTGLIVGGDR